MLGYQIIETGNARGYPSTTKGKSGTNNAADTCGRQGLFSATCQT